MKRNRTISKTALLFTSVSAILGSGWLFAAYYTSKIAGPSAILSWVIGGIAMVIVAFVYAELSAMIPITGSSARIPQYTHGTIVSFLFSWMIWLSYMALAPTEVQAVVQYLNYFFPTLTYGGGGLTQHGYFLATALMLAVSTINIFSLRWLLRCNSFLTVLKLVIPVLIALVILMSLVGEHHHNVLKPAHSKFFSYGLQGMLGAIATGGIVFAFNGFKQACEMAGEAKNPSYNLPFAIIGSIVICCIIYLVLQAAFLDSLNTHNLAYGWSNISIPGDSSPFAAIVHQDNINWLMPILYVGAIAGPLAAALMYVASAARSLYGTSKNGYLPELLQKLTAHGNPGVAIVVNFIIGMCLFAPLPGWDKMISFLTSLMAITYAAAPLCLIALRKQVPKQYRPFKLPFPMLWSYIAFYICTLLAFWSGWNILYKLGYGMIIGLALLFGYHFFSKRGKQITFNWKASIWTWPYFIGLLIISYLGSFGSGRNIIPFGWDFLIIAIFCLVIVLLAARYKLPAADTKAYIKELKLKHEGTDNE